MIKLYGIWSRQWLEPAGDSLVGGWAYCNTPLDPSLWYGHERGWEPVKEKSK